MTPENALKIEIEKAESLIEKLAEIPQTLQKEYPTWANVGDAKRLNSLLEEIIKIYK